MSYPLTIAFALSLAMHAALLVPGMMKRPATPSPEPALQAVLRPPPSLETLAAPEPLLKNTLEAENAAKVSMPPAPAQRAPARATPTTVTKREIEAAKKKLSKYIFYPEAALRLELEGTVRLFILLAADGHVEDVRLVASSGHTLLDNAAIKGFYAIGKLPGKSGEWSYTFQLLD